MVITPPRFKDASSNEIENTLSALPNIILILSSPTNNSSLTTVPVLLKCKTNVAFAATPPTPAFNSPSSVPATPAPVTTIAPLPCSRLPASRLPALPLTSTDAVTLLTPTFVTSPLCSNAKSPLNLAPASLLVKPVSSKIAPSTSTLKYGPAPNVNGSAVAPPRLKSPLFSSSTVFICTVTVPPLKLTPGTVNVGTPTWGTPTWSAP